MQPSGRGFDSRSVTFPPPGFDTALLAALALVASEEEARATLVALAVSGSDLPLRGVTFADAVTDGGNRPP